MKSIKTLFSKLTNTKQKKIIFSLISFLFVFLICFGLSKTNFVRNLLKLAGIYTQEEKVVELYSDGWEDNEPGSIHVTKSAEWVAEDTAEITFDIESKISTDTENVDVILAVSNILGEDASVNISEKLVEFANNLYEKNNTMSLLTFGEERITTDFIADKTQMIENINKISAKNISGNRSGYEDSLTYINTLLNNHTKQNDRELIIILLTGPQTLEGNHKARYLVLKENHPDAVVNAVIYDHSEKEIIYEYFYNTIVKSSDVQYTAQKSNLGQTLSKVCLNPIAYEKFVVTDYIDSDFYVENENQIIVPFGNIEILDENGIQKVIWTVPANEYLSGENIIFKIKVQLDSKYKNTLNYYATNKKEIITFNIKNQSLQTVESNKTPVLKNGYTVAYYANAPEGCNISNNESEIHGVFETVSLSSEEPVCEGYRFAGWEIKSENVEKVSAESFIMPSRDIEVVGTWTKVNISKSMTGTIYTRPNLYQLVQLQTLGTDKENNIDFSVASSETNGRGVYTFSGTENDEYPVYYYRGAVTNNNVIFANFCWKIVRTTETGGVKLIYNGVPSDGTCNNTGYDANLPDNTNYNEEYTMATYVGYMYGKGHKHQSFYNDVLTANVVYGNDVTWDGSQYTLNDTYTINGQSSDWANEYPDLAKKYHYTCISSTTKCETVYYLYYMYGGGAYYVTLENGETDPISTYVAGKDNTNSSILKNRIDTWYENNMTSYTKYLEDTTWCNDRSFYNSAGWTKDSDAALYQMEFGPYGRYEKTFSPSLTCPSVYDSFRVDNPKAKLKYPVATLTIDEIQLAGKNNNSKADSYIANRYPFYTMSPTYFLASITSNTYVYISDGSRIYLYSNFGVSPSLSLAYGAQYINGDGSVNSPYLIDDGVDYGTYYNIRVNSSAVTADYSSAKEKKLVKLSTVDENYAIKSFKLNGVLHNGNSFEMPAEDVVITDIVLIDAYVIQSAHNPYPNSQDNVVYGEKTFSGATSLNVELDYQTESTAYDWIYLYDKDGNEYGKYGGTTRTTEYITIPGDYVKLVFVSDGGVNNYYGFKAVVTANY